MTWISEIRNISGDTGVIRSVLSASGYGIAEEDNLWLLTHPKFANLETAQEVRIDTDTVIKRLLEMAELEGAKIDCTVGTIRKKNPDGSVNNHIFSKMDAYLILETHAASIVVENPNISEEERRKRHKEAEQREAERKRIAIIARMTAAIKDPRVIDVTKLLQKQHLSMTEAGHIIDLVQDACSGNMEPFASKTELQRFSRSINHPKIMGLAARHAVTYDTPPPNPMTEDEARSFAKHIGRTWLRKHESAP